MSSNARDERDSVPLPLATLLVDKRPEHALTPELYDPVVKRVAHVEAVIQTSVAARALRRIGLGQATVSCLACSTIAASVYRYRLQWRAMLALLGVGEAVLTSLNLLADLDSRDELALASVKDDKEADDSDHRLASDVRHLACFWIVYGSLAVLESVRSIATGQTGNGVQRSSVTARLRPLARRMRVMVRKLVNKYPKFEFLAPARPSVKRPFPQPRPINVAAAVPTPAVAKWLSSEVKYRIFKLLLLWTMLRRDGLGASGIWDWIVGPFYAVHRRRQVQTDDAGQKRRRIARIVIDDVEDETVPEAVSPRPDMFDQDSVSTSTSPAYTRHSYTSSRDYSAHDTSFSSSTACASSFSHESPFAATASSSTTASVHASPAFPTPNVPFRLTSTSHPIRATMASAPVSGVELGSPTPSRTAVKGYELGASIDSDKSWIGAKEWAS
ncbi:hypothetical protein ACM66B_005239 [Microbotryomycetes sp. NB124-2]